MSVHSRSGWLAALLATWVALPPGCARAAQGAVAVRVDPSVKYQTIRGWSCNPWYQGIAPRLRDQVVDEAVNQLGLTRIRWQPPGGSRAEERNWEWRNDDGDPDHIHWPAFATADADRQIRTWVLPFKQCVEANGDPFELWLSPSFFDGGSTGSAPAWLLRSPGEYAEYVIAYLLRLRQHGVEATHYVVCNEAGNNNAFTAPVVIEMTKVLGQRLAALGFRTRGQYSDGVNAHVTWDYVQAARDDPVFWKYVDVLSYHWYGSNNQQAMVKIRDFARTRGLDTGQTEYMGLTLNHLYDDLTLGGVSYWCIYGLGGPGTGGDNFGFSLSNTSFSRGAQFWNFRQVMHYVRPGAVRVEAISDDAGLRPLAFVRGGRMTLVLLNSLPPHRGRTAAVFGLSPGTYGECQSVGGQVYRELGLRTVGPAGSLTVDVPANSVLTLYPYPGRNQAPSVTEWRADPEYLTQPASKITLSASAQDPELDALSYSWKVVSQPAGARVVLATPDAATTAATGLTAPGQYRFALSVSDGRNTVRREVALNVNTGNQPPLPVDLHNRNPVRVTLPQSATVLRVAAHDLEGDPVRFHWRLVSQPRAGRAVLETPDEQRCRLSGLTVPGDYVVEVQVSDPTHTVPVPLRVPVYPRNTPPVIASASATPEVVSAPARGITLSAMTTDPDGDAVSHWWRVKEAPRGAVPGFSRQGRAQTRVTGLTVPGTYVFSLTAVDQSDAVTREVTVTVRGDAGGD